MRSERLDGETKSMQPMSSQFPDLQTLSTGLNSVMTGNGFDGGQVSILEREPVMWNTYPSEIVTCHLADGTELKLFCKYMACLRYNSYGHRGELPHEAKVYRHLLQPLQFSVPKFYGAFENVTTGETWLILEYLDQSLRLNKASQPEAILRAAHWIGRFHAANETLLPSPGIPVLNTYDTEYYLGWVRRTSLFAGPLHQRFPWLEALCERFEEFIAILLSSPLTAIHGEYYPRNILVSGGVVYPIDWESAAIAAGEIDLASLTEAWGAEIIRLCKLEYQRARWPEGSPPNFEQRLTAAQLYFFFRWLGDRPDLTVRESYLGYFKQLRSAGERLGLI
jgi:thiamine kinase-like enzyme